MEVDMLPLFFFHNEKPEFYYLEQQNYKHNEFKDITSQIDRSHPTKIHTSDHRGTRTYGTTSVP
jgi:hypothetical protein